MCPEAGTLALNVIRVTCDGAQDGSGDEDGDRPKSHGPLELRHIGGLTSGQKKRRAKWTLTNARALAGWVNLFLIAVPYKIYMLKYTELKLKELIVKEIYLHFLRANL